MAQSDMCLTGDQEAVGLRQYSFMEIDHEIISMVILPFSLIQEGQ